MPPVLKLKVSTVWMRPELLRYLMQAVQDPNHPQLGHAQVDYAYLTVPLVYTVRSTVMPCRAGLW